MKETAWVIERHIGSALHYWTGSTAGGKISWTTNHAMALRFSRKTDAERMLSWHCDDIGRVAEHQWLEKEATE